MSVEVKNARSYTSTPSYIFMERSLIKHLYEIQDFRSREGSYCGLPIYNTA